MGLLPVQYLHAQKAVKGVIDLRNYTAGNPLPLAGEWGFYWQQLRSSDSAASPAFSNLPNLWNSIGLPGQGYATYRLTLLLPPNHSQLGALLVPDFYTAFKLYANGQLIASDGQVGTSKETEVAHWSTQVVPLPTNSDTVTLFLQISNFIHAKGGVVKLPQIGSLQLLTQQNKQYTAQDIFLGGCLFMGGIFFLGLFVFAQRQRSILYFALFCIAYSYRIVGTDLYALHSIFPQLGFQATIRMEYISLCLSIGFYTLYVRSLYPKESSALISKILLAISLSYGFSAMVAPVQLFTSLINYFLILLLAFIGYGIYIFIKAWRRKRPGAKYGAWSGGVIIILFLLTIANYFGLIPPVKIVELTGYITFFFLQSLVLAHRSWYYLQRARLQAEEGLQAKTRFLSTMSHEIRTPLNAVLGITQLLQKDNDNLDVQQREYVDALSFSGGNLLTIVNDILDYGKAEAGKLTLERADFDIRDVVQKVAAGFAQAAKDKGIVLLVDIDEKVPAVLTSDPMRISQVLYNLLGNAVKFTPAGQVRVAVKRVDDAANSTQCYIEFTVADTGIGIAADKLPLIFEPFTQADSSTSRSYGGTGLGLAICKKIIELQGSSLHVSSQLGQGSAFSFTMLYGIATNAVPAVVNQPVTAEPVAVAGATVLLVEDNNMNTMIASRMLEKNGLMVEVAVNGKEAVTVFDAKKHALVLMDLHMPVMDGYEAARAIRSINTAVPIIALTANVADDLQEQITNCGMNAVLTKPFKQAALIDLLTEYLPAHKKE